MRQLVDLILEAAEVYRVYRIKTGTKEEEEVFAGPMEWCGRYMSTHEAGDGYHFTTRSPDAVRRINIQNAQKPKQP